MLCSDFFCSEVSHPLYPDFHSACPDFIDLLLDDSLCRNFDLWADKECTDLSRRCRGNRPGECYFYESKEQSEELGCNSTFTGCQVFN